ncbi:serine/threonine protein kinase [Sandaracinus amylolyticus]|uniref:serine/threonine protein kinase n=1 Tax=Sandaracinus amylolyticus TaxID=927083 RepID=UPI001F02487B|nr:serine/threonine-protein kinase [Sandaracinus amylolyticus]UJR80935.1 Serine/threonine protein kinase [Sandaracinus amylolyticus]
MRISRPPPPPPAPPPHSRFGPYTLADRIAVGGMAEVFRAHEPRAVGDPRVVVVKRMLPALASEAGARAMFEEEARLGGLVEHDNVVRVLGFGDEAGQPYLALEYVPGLDLWRLARWLTRQGRTLGTELAVFVIRELLAGLHAVHETHDHDGRPLGLVHRDVSPSNVLLSVHGDVKLGDFGIAQALLRESYPQATLTERAKGKLGYLAPEQVRGLAADRRADVFAAAVIAAELLMGRPLFAGGSELAVLLAIRDGDLRAFEEHGAGLPEGLRAAVVAALASDPDARTVTAAILRDALAPYEVGPVSALRAQLAGLVSEAHGARKPSGAYQPAVRGPKTAPPGDEDAEAPATRDAPELAYFVRTSDGRTEGPLSYAKLVEAIATRRFGLTDAIALQGGAFASLASHPDLVRHLPTSSLSDRTARQEPVREPDRAWSLEDGSVVGVMTSVVLARETGLLLCEQGGVRKEIYLSNGVPEFVTSNLATELLGEFLVARGVISRGELDMALAVMPRFEGRLGDTLTALGLVEPVHLFRQIAAQVQEKLLELFTWTSGRATLWRGVARPQSGFPLGLDPWRIVMDGIDRRLAQGMDDPLAAHRGKWVVASGPNDLELARLPLSARSAYRRAAQPVPIVELDRALSDPSGRDARAGRRAIALLLAIGALSTTDGPGAS